jgi:hypothetical protein
MNSPFKTKAWCEAKKAAFPFSSSIWVMIDPKSHSRKSFVFWRNYCARLKTAISAVRHSQIAILGNQSAEIVKTHAQISRSRRQNTLRGWRRYSRPAWLRHKRPAAMLETAILLIFSCLIFF